MSLEMVGSNWRAIICVGFIEAGWTTGISQNYGYFKTNSLISLFVKVLWQMKLKHSASMKKKVLNKFPFKVPLSFFALQYYIQRFCSFSRCIIHSILSGYLSLAGIAYAIPDAFYLQLVVALGILPFAPLLLFVTESPKWLLATGKCCRVFLKHV